MRSLLRSLSLYWATSSRNCRSSLFSLTWRTPTLVGFTVFTTGITSVAMSSSNQFDTGYLNAKDAAALDVALMSVPGYTLEQLMELAGLSVAEAVYQVLASGDSTRVPKRILVVCGPGNNGGDGLVAARHLVMFGYEAKVVYPKKSQLKHPHYTNLIQQCEDLGIAAGTLPARQRWGASRRGTPLYPRPARSLAHVSDPSRAPASASAAAHILRPRRLYLPAASPDCKAREN